MAETKDKWAELRKAFDPKVVGKLPRGGTQLDYVGHAAVTDRLLSVDPEWTWEPLAVNEWGLPTYDEQGGLWIKLTVLGVTRLGYGDGNDPKVRIGDAIRNAAMRFGVALDLWTKDELESNLDHPENKNIKTTKQIEDNIIKSTSRLEKPSEYNHDLEKLKIQARALMSDKGLIKEKATEFLSTIIDKDKPVTKQDYIDIIAALETE